ncbi:MmgE/PrpD family protein [Belnapia rosea]|uniref:2-methylcitrate dehydratase PrpD n=1 Tax=Belnapia rosea TaxID=938405 RepID=A0A1G6LDK4_9PROT|nr:MmgE/PrpD family protein [Belnapia rosea]SDB49021.1 2-methylcitrate dehydratase PrpD [Belnapia rosea]SDC41273.1 2-methylcitrate dehydratase PrpD [Belnapia rosea]
MVAVTEIIADYCASLDFATLPPEVQERTRFLVLDLVGNIVRGRHDAESTPALLSMARALGLAAGGSAVLGDSARYTPAGAALLNGALAHSLDFDDTHAAGTLHPGAPVIPAALAAAEMVGANGRTVLSAIVAGYEVTCRLALALPGGDHYDRGYHPTATCGAFGAAAAAARVFGLDAKGMQDAFGIALSQAAGSLQFLANGAWTKRFQVGWSAMNGLAAATLAREGFRGAAEAFEGKAGFLRAYAPNPVPERALQGLGQQFELMNTAVKPYPSCRYGHAGIDAAIEFHKELGLKAEEIEAVTMGLPNKGMLLVGAPLAYKQNPQNVVDGQFSGPFVVACGLVHGHMGWDSYALLQDPAVRSVLPKVTCVEDPEVQALFPEYMSGKLTLRARGQEHVRLVKIAKGEPENFLTEAELRAKFHGLVDAVLGRERAMQLADAVITLDRAADVNGMLRLGAPMMAARLAGE